MATPNLVSFTAAHVDLAYQDNETWQDAFQFGVVGDTSWSFGGCTFHMDVKGDLDDVNPLFQLNSANNRILLVDSVQRIIQFNANFVDVQAALHPGRFYYDLVMLDASTPAVRTLLMRGRVRLCHGVTQS